MKFSSFKLQASLIIFSAVMFSCTEKENEINEIESLSKSNVITNQDTLNFIRGLSAIYNETTFLNEDY
jgi:hypothetical protein